MELPKRKNIRLKSYDYSRNGEYFVTICTQHRLHLFGEIVGAGLVSAHSQPSNMILNDAGKMVDTMCDVTVCDFSGFELNKYIIMPNHVHMIVVIERAETSPAPTIGDFICAFKSKTTNAYIIGVKNGIYDSFDKRIWQRNYYEHIIRSENEYTKIWEYIDQNPSKWQDDCLMHYPNNYSL